MHFCQGGKQVPRGDTPTTMPTPPGTSPGEGKVDMMGDGEHWHFPFCRFGRCQILAKFLGYREASFCYLQKRYCWCPPCLTELAQAIPLCRQCISSRHLSNAIALLDHFLPLNSRGQGGMGEGIGDANRASDQAAGGGAHRKTSRRSRCGEGRRDAHWVGPLLPTAAHPSETPGARRA